jgi:O-6-methylguanine DNA methyltransferase
MSSLALHVDILVGPQGITSAKLCKTSQNFSWTIQGVDSWNAEINAWMEAYGQRKPLEDLLIVDLSSMTYFSQHILDEMQRIPFGQTLSYKGLAQACGKPKAARAVGNACGRNPVPLIVPCHRVIASNGSIGGFSLDPNLKTILLSFESGM